MLWKKRLFKFESHWVLRKMVNNNKVSPKREQNYDAVYIKRGFRITTIQKHIRVWNFFELMATSLQTKRMASLSNRNWISSWSSYWILDEGLVSRSIRRPLSFIQRASLQTTMSRTSSFSYTMGSVMLTTSPPYLLQHLDVHYLSFLSTNEYALNIFFWCLAGVMGSAKPILFDCAKSKGVITGYWVSFSQQT